MTGEPLQQAVLAASQCHYRLVLVVGPPRSGKTRNLQRLAEAQDFDMLNLNLRLSERLLELTQKQRSVRVQRLLSELVEADAEDVVLLDNIEVLFDRDLRLDPLRVLQQLARNRTVVAAWPGIFIEGALTYAEPGHPEAQKYIDPEATVVLAARVKPLETKTARKAGDAR